MRLFDFGRNYAKHYASIICQGLGKTMRYAVPSSSSVSQLLIDGGSTDGKTRSLENNRTG